MLPHKQKILQFLQIVFQNNHENPDFLDSEKGANHFLIIHLSFSQKKPTFSLTDSANHFSGSKFFFHKYLSSYAGIKFIFKLLIIKLLFYLKNYLFYFK